MDRTRAQKIVTLLLRDKVLVKVTEDLFFHRDALQSLKQAVISYRANKSAKIDVAAFRDLTGLTRKYTIPLLEWLDREHVTRRVEMKELSCSSQLSALSERETMMDAQSQVKRFALNLRHSASSTSTLSRPKTGETRMGTPGAWCPVESAKSPHHARVRAHHGLAGVARKGLAKFRRVLEGAVDAVPAGRVRIRKRPQPQHLRPRVVAPDLPEADEELLLRSEAIYLLPSPGDSYSAQRQANAAIIRRVLAKGKLAVQVNVVDRHVPVLVNEALRALLEIRVLGRPPVAQISMGVELAALIVEAVRQLMADDSADASQVHRDRRRACRRMAAEECRREN